MNLKLYLKPISTFTLLLIVSSIRAQHATDSLKTHEMPAVHIKGVIGNELTEFSLPGSCHLISKAKLDEFKYTDINRILKQLPGVNIQEEDGFGLRPNIGLRASGSDRSAKITLMEDGILIAPAPYAAPAAYYFPTIGRMQGVEIIKGSSQIRFGPNTNGGVLNLVSTQIPTASSGFFQMGAGSFGQRNVHAYAGSKYEQVGFLVETYQAGSDGFKTLPNGGNTGYKIQDYLVKLKVNTKSTARFYQSFEFKVGQSNQQANETYLGISDADFKQNPTQRYAASSLDHIVSNQSQFIAQHEIILSRHTSLQTDIYRTDFARNWYKLDRVTDTAGNSLTIASIFDQNNKSFISILRGESEGLLTVRANNRSYYAQGIQTALHSDFKTGNMAHKWVIGLRIHQDAFDRYQWDDTYQIDEHFMQQTNAGIQGSESNRIQKANALATYAQYEGRWKRWTIVPGIRYEHISMRKKDYGKADSDRTAKDLTVTENKQFVLLPGLGITYMTSDHLVAIGGAHRGFSPAGFTTNAKPEESINMELGMRYKKVELEFSAITFYSTYTNLLGADNLSAGGTGSGDLYNGGKAKAYGIECMASYNLLKDVSYTFRLPIGMTYTYTKAQFLSSFDSEFEGWGPVSKNDDLPYLPNHQLGFSIGIQQKDFCMYYNLKYQSQQLSVAGTKILDAAHKIPAYAVSDVSVSYNLNERIQCYSSVLNLFDKRYIASRAPAGVRPGIPRSFGLGIKMALK